MEPTEDAEVTDCPCLLPAIGRRGGAFPMPVYCRLPTGRVRVPTRDQLASLCTGGQHQNCPGYRRWASHSTWTGG